MDLEGLLTELGGRNGSDLHLKAGRPPLFRLSGDLLPQPYPEVTPAEMRSALWAIMPKPVQRSFDETLEADFSYEVPNVARFRVNVFTQRGSLGACFRLIPIEVPTIERLGLPEVLREFADHVNGLVAVTGPTGSGKSTTLACMIEHVNQTRPVHVITIEDPVEFVYTDRLATVNQRELGIDTFDLSAALRAAMRQDPDVILMGEIRDRETMKFALTAAETGHLVFSTLHTNDAKQSLDRMIDIFPPDQQEQVRQQLALVLRGIISQRLMKRADGAGMIPTIEILVNTAHVTELIEKGATRDIEKAIADGRHYKMQTFNQSMLELVRAGLVTEEEAMDHSSSPEELKMGLRGITKGTASSAVFDLDFGDEKKKRSAGAAPGARPPEPPRPKGGGKPKVSRGFDL